METNSGNHPSTLPVGQIVLGRNPRKHFDEAYMAELEENIRAQGVNQPVLVRPLMDGKYELVAGGRRVRAFTKVFGPDGEIPVMVKELNDAQADEAALSENTHRAAMTPVEEAEAAAKVLANCGGDRAEAAKRMGWTPSTLDRRLALMYATDKVRAALQERKIDLGHAELLAICRKEAQDQALEILLARDKKMTVQELKSYIDNQAAVLDTAIFDKTDCASCHHNSGNQSALFAEVISGGRCSNKQCFTQKTDAQLEAQVTALSEDYQKVHVVRPGENFTVIALRAEGDKGVGAEQAQACRTCKNFGAVVSGLPDKLGAEYKSICFDVPCNTTKVAERVAAEKAKATPRAALGAQTPGGQNADAEPGSTPPSKVTPVQRKKPEKPAYPEPSNRVQEYREVIWRKVFKAFVSKLDTVNNRVVLLALCLKHPGHIDSHELGAALGDKKTTSSTGSLGAAVKSLRAMSNDDLSASLQCIAANVKSGPAGLSLNDVVSVLKEYDVQLSRYWKVEQAFLELLTKNEIDAVCQEIGVSQAMGDGYAKARGQSKTDYIKAVLSIEGFDFKGRIPKLMAW